MREELDLYADTDQRARTFSAGIGTRPVFPDAFARQGLARFDEPLPQGTSDATETIALLDAAGSPAAVAFNDPRYYGFVVGATLPAAAAAERLALAWDQASSDTHAAPAPAAIEAVAARWCVEILDLPRQSAVGFTTGASTSNLVALVTARRALLDRLGWDLDRRGLHGAPHIRVVVSDAHHVTLGKALRILGFGTDELVRAPVDDQGRVLADRLPELDSRTILVLQAGEVHTGESDPFAHIVPAARTAGAWTHVDGAFGLWARASGEHRHLVAGVEQADSWSIDAHKWLNTPYDSGMVICRDTVALERAMSSDAAYTAQTSGAQRNHTLEFSRRARGIAVWAALRTLGRDGVADLVDSRIALAQRAAQALRQAGFSVLNRVVLNQVLLDMDTSENARGVSNAVQESGQAWLGPSTWRGRPVIRISVSSWRTTEQHIDDLVQLLIEIRANSERAGRERQVKTEERGQEGRHRRDEAISGLEAIKSIGLDSPLTLFDGGRDATETSAVQVSEDVVNRFFEIDVDGQHAGILVYEIAGNRRILTHTFIQEGYRGRGLVTRLLTSALSALAADGHTVTSDCPIVNEFMLKHPEFSSVLDPEHPGSAVIS